MSIDDKTLERLEKLSKVTIDDEKRESFKKELAEIVDFVENLNELDLENEKASFDLQKKGTPLRADEVQNSNIIKDLLKDSPKVEDTSFIVPKIIN